MFASSRCGPTKRDHGTPKTSLPSHVRVDKRSARRAICTTQMKRRRGRLGVLVVNVSAATGVTRSALLHSARMTRLIALCKWMLGAAAGTPKTLGFRAKIRCAMAHTIRSLFYVVLTICVGVCVFVCLGGGVCVFLHARATQHHDAALAVCREAIVIRALQQVH